MGRKIHKWSGGIQGRNVTHAARADADVSTDLSDEDSVEARLRLRLRFRSSGAITRAHN